MARMKELEDENRHLATVNPDRTSSGKRSLFVSVFRRKTNGGWAS